MQKELWIQNGEMIDIKREIREVKIKMILKLREIKATEFKAKSNRNKVSH